MARHNNTAMKIMIYNGEKVKKWNHNGVQVFSAGNIVTYHVDAEITYSEEVDSDASCLSPTTFTPQKEGWSFVGWREDETANADVLTEKKMDSDPITLYAVYEQTIVLSYDGNKATSGSVASQSETAYCNASGSVLYPEFTIASNEFARSGWTFDAWAYDSAGQTQIDVDRLTLMEDTTIYATWLPISFTVDLSTLDFTTTYAGAMTSYDGEYMEAGSSWHGTICENGYIMASYCGQNGSCTLTVADIPTNGCNKVRITCGAEHFTDSKSVGSITVGDTIYTIDEVGNGLRNLVFDCPEDTIDLIIKAGDMTNYWTARVMVSEIYFYSEE